MPAVLGYQVYLICVAPVYFEKKALTLVSWNALHPLPLDSPPRKKITSHFEQNVKWHRSTRGYLHLMVLVSAPCHFPRATQFVAAVYSMVLTCSCGQDARHDGGNISLSSHSAINTVFLPFVAIRYLQAQS